MSDPKVLPVDDRERPLPKVSIFDHSTATTDAVVAALVESGGCVIRGVVGAEDLASIERSVRPFLDADKAWEGEFFPVETRRTSGLAQKSATFMKQIACNTLYQQVCSKM